MLRPYLCFSKCSSWVSRLRRTPPKLETGRRLGDEEGAGKAVHRGFCLQTSGGSDHQMPKLVSETEPLDDLRARPDGRRLLGASCRPLQPRTCRRRSEAQPRRPRPGRLDLRAAPSGSRLGPSRSFQASRRSRAARSISAREVTLRGKPAGNVSSAPDRPRISPPPDSDPASRDARFQRFLILQGKRAALAVLGTNLNDPLAAVRKTPPEPPGPREPQQRTRPGNVEAPLVLGDRLGAERGQLSQLPKAEPAHFASLLDSGPDVHIGLSD